MGCAMCLQLVDMWTVSVSRSAHRAMELTTAYPEALQQGGYHRVTGLHYMMSSFSDAEDCCDDSMSTTGSSHSHTTDWQGGAQGSDD